MMEQNSMTQVSDNGHKWAILYARVSTDDQAEKGYSLPSQFDAMRKYASAQGFEIVAEFQDDYSGATPIEHRPEGRKAYTMLQSGDADLIVAYTIDRFVRPPEDGDEWEMPILIRGLAKLGKEIHTCDIGKLKTDFVSLLLVVIGAKSAGEERRKIRERSMRGKLAKARSGRVVGTRPPYGYRHVRDEHGKVITLEIDETNARIVRLIYKWYVHGDENGKRLSTDSIAKRLFALNIPTPGELQRGYKKTRGKAVWGRGTILDILDNEVYAGVWRYNVQIRKTNLRRPRDEQIEVSVPAIVARATWKQVQDRRKRNKQMSKRNGKRDYLLRGLLACECGSNLSGKFNWQRYYHCNQAVLRAVDCACRARVVRADAIEADIWDEIKELFRDLERLWAELKAAQRNEDDKLKPMREKLQITDDLIKRFESEANKIAKALPDAARGGAVWKSLKDAETNVNARLDELAKQREKIIKELGTRKLTDECIETIMTFARKVRNGIDRASFDAKRRMLETLGVKVFVKNGHYKLTCILGVIEGTVRKIPRSDSLSIVSTSQMPPCRTKTRSNCGFR
jgi:site-specific DNA recombinase